MLKKTLAVAAVALTLNAATAFAQVGDAAPGTTMGGYNPATGEIIVSGTTILNWVIQANSEGDVFDPSKLLGLPPVAGGLNTNAPNVIGVGVFAPPGQTFKDFNLGPVAPIGMLASDFFIQSEANFGSPSIRTPLITIGGVIIPEPASVALVSLLGIAGAMIRRR
jgi:hypothetical protein